jgi:hypothetical protein
MTTFGKAVPPFTQQDIDDRDWKIRQQHDVIAQWERSWEALSAEYEEWPPLMEAAEARIEQLELLGEYAAHASWRCDYRSRYGECRCGLDELTDRLGLPRVEPHDPEAK